MGKRRTQANYSNQYQIIKLVLMNLCTTIVSILLCVFLASILGLKLDLDEKLMYYFTYPIIAVCAFLNGYFMARKIKIKGWLVGLVSNLIFLLFMILFHFIIGISSYNESFFLLKLGLIILCGILGGIVGVNKKRKIR